MKDRSHALTTELHLAPVILVCLLHISALLHKTFENLTSFTFSALVSYKMEVYNLLFLLGLLLFFFLLFCGFLSGGYKHTKIHICCWVEGFCVDVVVFLVGFLDIKCDGGISKHNFDYGSCNYTFPTFCLCNAIYKYLY